MAYKPFNNKDNFPRGGWQRSPWRFMLTLTPADQGKLMSDHPDDDTLSIQIANQVINVANTRTQDGVDAKEVAQGLRHAAANFSAFAEFQRRNDGAEPDPAKIVEEFIQFLEYYMGRHGADGKPGEGPMGGLEQLIEKAKSEL
jgi:hypothetical protein